MDPYLFSLILGSVGLLAMAVTGIGRHGHGSASSGHGHANGHGGSHAGHGGHGAQAGHGAHGGHGSGSSHSTASAFGSGAMQAAGWALMAPRFLFAGLIGFGVAGLVLRTWVGGAVLIGSALLGAVLFERLLMAPLWNFALRFESKEALTLESGLTADAIAVTSFDKNGQGIISVEIDGQIQQVLATLMPRDREAGLTVRSGQMVRIEEVDSARQRCKVTVL